MRWALLAGLIAFSANAGIILSGSPRAAAPVVAGGGAFVRPIGHPDVPAGLAVDTALPTLPNPWTTSTAGFYYVKQGGSAVDNGTPAAPRGTFPTLCAGCVVVVDNTATMTVTNLTLDFAAGTSGSRVWLIGSNRVELGSGTTKARIDHTGDIGIIGDHFYIDGMRFHAANENQIGVAFGGGGSTVQNALIRNVEIDGTGLVRLANSGNSMQGASASVLTQNVVFYNVEIHHLGNYDPAPGEFGPTDDFDVHCLQINDFVADVWVWNSNFHHCQGDGIQFTASGDSTPFANFAVRVYVGKSEASFNLQAGFWLKHGDDIIFSQNYVHDQKLKPNIGSGTGDPICMGGQYDIAEVWYLFNHLENCDNPFRFASNSTTLRSNLNLVGNIIVNASWAGSGNSNSAFTWGSAISFWQGGTCRLIGNTIYKFTGHGIAATPGSCSGMIAENNIVNTRVNATFADLFLEGGGGWTDVRARNNIFPTSPRLSSNGSTWTTVATFEAADAANRQNNQADDPLFVTAADTGGNFDTQALSPARDAGTINTDIYATYNTQYSLDIRKDYVGTTRPQNTVYDIGAYEH